MSRTLGRLPASQVGKPVIYDAPEKVVSAMLTQQDAIIDALAALCAKLDADAGVTDTNYASTISSGLSKIDLFE